MRYTWKWEWTFVSSALFWFAIGGLAGLLLPLLRAFSADSTLLRVYAGSVTTHGVLMVFGGLFQLMVGLCLLHGRVMGGRIDEWSTRLPALLWLSTNVGLAFMAVSVFGGFAPSYVLVYPLPLVGADVALWPRWALLIALVGIALVLLAVLYLYPAAIARSLFGRLLPTRTQLRGLIPDPGSLGMSIYALVMPILGLPVFLFAAVIFLVALGLLRPETIPIATSARSFNVAFWLFAHNLMEAMGIMTLGAIYAIVPRYTRSGQLYSPRAAVVAMILYTMAAIPAFGHHLYTWVTGNPEALQNVSRSTSWATGFIAATLTAFNVGLTVWRNGLRAHPAPLLILGGLLLYLIDGFVALELSTPAWNLRLHGTLYATAHTMTILTAVLLVFFGVTYHYYPALREYQLDLRLGYLHGGLSFVAALAMFFSLLAGGVAGLPRRAYPWLPGENAFAVPLLLFGLLFALAQGLFAWNLWRTERARATVLAPAPAAD